MVIKILRTMKSALNTAQIKQLKMKKSLLLKCAIWKFNKYV